MSTALPAEATQYLCNYRQNSAGTEQIRLCVLETTDHQMYGDMTYWNSTNLSQGLTGTLIVQRCTTAGASCVTITAMSVDEWVYSFEIDTITTSKKAGASGYAYKTCASMHTTTGWSFTYNCSPLNQYG